MNKFNKRRKLNEEEIEEKIKNEINDDDIRENNILTLLQIISNIVKLSNKKGVKKIKTYTFSLLEQLFREANITPDERKQCIDKIHNIYINS